MIEWINGFQIGVCIVKIMCNPALRDRHWVEMSEIAGKIKKNWHSKMGKKKLSYKSREKTNRFRFDARRRNIITKNHQIWH